MPSSIHDLYFDSLTEEQLLVGKRQVLLRYSDHLLRRFGLAEVLVMQTDDERPLTVRAEADELWALVRGSAAFELHDRRDGSPSHDQTQIVRCSEPTRILVPFGVALKIQAISGPVELIRLATHEDEPPSD